MQLGPRDTLTGRLEQIFNDVEQEQDRCIIQVSESSYITISGHSAARLDLGCRQLWLAAFRDYQDLPPEPKKTDLLAKSRKSADEIILFSFASLAFRLGFDSKQIRNTLQNSPDRKLAERTLLTVRKPGQYKYANFEESVEQIMSIFATAEPFTPSPSDDASNVDHCRTEPTRFGMPHSSDHDRDRQEMFLPQMLQGPEDTLPRMTSFFVRQSVYFAFFKRELPAEVDINTESNTTPLELINFQRSQPAQMDISQVDEEAERSATLSSEIEQRRNELTEILNEITQQKANFHQITEETEQKRAELQNLSTQQTEEEERRNKTFSEHQQKLNQVIARETEQNRRIEQLAAQELEKDGEIQRLDQLIRTKEEELSQLIVEERHKQERLEEIDELLRTQQDKVDFGAREQEENHQSENHQSKNSVVSLEQHAAEEVHLRNREEEQREEATDGDEMTSLATGDISQNVAKSDQQTRRVTRFEFSKLLTGPEDDVSSTRDTSKIPIVFKTRSSDGNLVVTNKLDVDPADPSVVQRVAEKYLRKHFCLFDVEYHNLIPKTCFEKVTANGTNTIIVIPVSRVTAPSENDTDGRLGTNGERGDVSRSQLAHRSKRNRRAED
ncbi:hypothetical protein FOBRF1_000040 [Fusarium oxysporum]